MTYRVIVGCEDKRWLAAAPDLEGAHTWAPDLVRLDRYAREVVALAADLPDGAERHLDVEWVVETGDHEVDAAVAAVLAERPSLTPDPASVARRTDAAAAVLARHGWSAREIARALGLPHHHVVRLLPRRGFRRLVRAPH